MMRYALLALALLAAPASAQITANLPVTCNASGSICTAATAVTNPDGTLIGTGGTGSSGITRGTITETSGTITLGGTAQTATAANTGRSYISCQNPPTATEPLYYRFAGAASATGNSKSLQPGAEFTYATGFVPTQALSIVAATTGHAFTCWVG